MKISLKTEGREKSIFCHQDFFKVFQAFEYSIESVTYCVSTMPSRSGKGKANQDGEFRNVRLDKFR